VGRDQPGPALPPEPLPDRIARRIESGEWAELPLIKDLAAAFGRSRTNVSAALRELADCGLVGKDYAKGSSGRWVVARTADRAATPKR
jgi:DNA-binding GntR family transcriptional regulator